MDAIRLGIVGLGGICRHRHVPGFKDIAGVELAAVANRSRESSEAAAKAFGIAEVCDTWKDMVDRDDLDAIVVGTWPYMHHSVSVAALQAGKHVFCQARMAMNAKEAREMYDAACLSGKVAMLCPVPIGMSVDQTIARLLAEKAIGDVHLVSVQSFSDAWADPETPMNWRKDHRLSGLNMQTLGMYAEVVHRWFGWTRSVSAQSQTFTAERKDETGHVTRVQIPDQVLASAEMDNGVTAQYAITGVAPYGNDAIDIFGSAGTLHYDVAEDRLCLAGPAPGGKDAVIDTNKAPVGKAATMRPVDIRPEDAYDTERWHVEQDFIDAIREGKAYHPNFEDGLRYMQVVQAVHDASSSQRTVVL